MVFGKLTALKAKAAKKPGRHTDGNGLTLLVKASGSRSWVLRIQVAGKRRDFGLGSFDDVSPAEARDKALELRKQYQSGIDPVAAKKAVRNTATSMPTFGDAARSAYEERKETWRNKKHAAQWMTTLDSYALPYIGDVPVDQVDGPAVRDLLANIWLTKPETARRVRQRIGVVLDWAFAKGYRDAEAHMKAISKGLPPQPKKDSHLATLPYEKAAHVMAELAKSESVGKLALRFLILTAARSGEVRGATWQEIDLDEKTWTITGSRMKAGKEHIVPLSPQAIAILDTVSSFGGNPRDVVFPGKSRRPISDATLSKVLRDNFSFKATVHGFRSTFRDWAVEKTDVLGDIVEAALAHTVNNKVEAAYRRTNYLEKRRGLMRLWSEFIAPEGSPEL